MSSRAAPSEGPKSRGASAEPQLALARGREAGPGGAGGGGRWPGQPEPAPPGLPKRPAEPLAPRCPSRCTGRDPEGALVPPPGAQLPSGGATGGMWGRDTRGAPFPSPAAPPGSHPRLSPVVLALGEAYLGTHAGTGTAHICTVYKIRGLRFTRVHTNALTHGLSYMQRRGPSSAGAAQGPPRRPPRRQPLLISPR